MKELSKDPSSMRVDRATRLVAALLEEHSLNEFFIDDSPLLDKAETILAFIRAGCAVDQIAGNKKYLVRRLKSAGPPLMRSRHHGAQANDLL